MGYRVKVCGRKSNLVLATKQFNYATLIVFAYLIFILFYIKYIILYQILVKLNNITNSLIAKKF